MTVDDGAGGAAPYSGYASRVPSPPSVNSTVMSTTGADDEQVRTLGAAQKHLRRIALLHDSLDIRRRVVPEDLP
jgi:hypothetical protein